MKNPFADQVSHFEGDIAHFLKGIQKFLLLNNIINFGLLIGTKRISIKKSLQGALILAKTGFGKSAYFLIPFLTRIKKASIIVLDPSGEIHALTAKYLSKNFIVKVLDISNPDSKEKYNPFASCKTKEDIALVADAIIQAAYPNSKAESMFWNNGATLVIYILACSLLNQPHNFNLVYVYQLLNRLGYDKDSVYKHLDDNLDIDLWNQFKGLMSNSEKVWLSILGTAKVALSSLSNPNLAKISSENTIDFKSFRKTPTVLFVCVPEHQVKFYGFYLSLFFRECFESFMELPTRKDLVTYMLLDEGGNIYIPQLDTYVTVLRKRKVSVSLILQSMQQLRALYGDNAPIISENLLSHLYYSGLSNETCNELSQKLGKTIKKPAFSFLPSNEKNEPSPEKIPLMSPSAIRCMKSNRALYIYGNLPPVLVKLKPWFKSFSMKRKLRR